MDYRENCSPTIIGVTQVKLIILSEFMERTLNITLVYFRTNFPADFHDRNPQKVFQTNEVDFFIGRILNEANIHRVLDMSMPVDEAE